MHYHGYDGGEDDATVGRDAKVEEDARIEQDGRVTRDASVINIEASISAASLADDCGSRAESPGLIGDCAPPPEDCVGDECNSYCGFCQQSNMQLSLNYKGHDGGAEVQIDKVELLDSTGKNVLDELNAYEPKIWNGDIYTAWDEFLPAPGSKVSYNLTAPDWKQIGSGEAWQTYSMVFYLRVTLTMEGETVAITSDEIMREPEIVT